MQKPNGIVLFHPGTPPFVRQVAQALHESGLLIHYHTSFVANSNSKWQIAISRLAQSLGYDISQQFNKRRVDELPQDKIVTNATTELLRTFFRKIDGRGVWSDIVWELCEKRFDRWVSKSFVQEARAIYGYEYASLSTFRRARECGLKCIYDVPSPNHDYVHRIIDRELERFPKLKTDYQHRVNKRHAERSQRRVDEWNLADVVMANSELTKESYKRAGFNTDKVVVIPYGAPSIVKRAENECTNTGKVHFLYAGSLSIRKGGHYLLQAWRQLEGVSGACLTIVGGIMDIPPELMHHLPHNLKRIPSVSYEELSSIYMQSDVLVFPTLCDGFGLVVTEAMAHGLPVLTTEQAGASMIIENKVNGLLVEAASATALSRGLEWFCDHQEQLPGMREKAYETANNWHWSHYRKEFARRINLALDQILPV